MTFLPKLAVADDESRERLVNALMGHAKTKGIEVEEDPTAARNGGGRYEQDTRKVKIAPGVQKQEHGANLLAHEIGHAEFDQSMLGRLVQSPGARAMGGVSVSIGMMIALTATGSLQRRMAMSTGAVAAGQIPLLTGEAMAWYKGHEMMKEHGATPEQLAHLRSDATHFGSTYLQPAAIGMGGSLILAALAHAANP